MHGFWCFDSEAKTTTLPNSSLLSKQNPWPSLTVSPSDGFRFISKRSFLSLAREYESFEKTGRTWSHIMYLSQPVCDLKCFGRRKSTPTQKLCRGPTEWMPTAVHHPLSLWGPCGFGGSCDSTSRCSLFVGINIQDCLHFFLRDMISLRHSAFASFRSLSKIIIREFSSRCCATINVLVTLFFIFRGQEGNCSPVIGQATKSISATLPFIG